VRKDEQATDRSGSSGRAGGALQFHGGLLGSLAPFAVFLGGVAWLALSGAPDERGFWPVLLGALALGLILARDRRAYSETAIRGMSRPIVMLMVMAWMLAGVLGALINASGFIESLIWLADQTGLSGRGFVIASFLVCSTVSTATGTSLGTILICSPLLYPAGGLVGAHPAVLVGAILGGATFGDNISPISDTTIASSATQGADIGGVVRSRLRYALPAATLALIGYLWLGGAATGAPGAAESAGALAGLGGDPRGLPMLLAPAVAIGLLLAGRHLLEGLMFGGLAALGLGLGLGLLDPADILRIDTADFVARGLIVDGMERGVGVAVFTFLLMGLVAGLEATGTLDRMVAYARRRTRSARGAELWIFGTVSAAVLLTTHSAVAILTVGRFAREAGEAFGVSAYRRSNVLDVTVCTYPFVLPFAIPTILTASTTVAGAEFGLPRISPLATGLYNLHSWALLAVLLVAILTGYGRRDG